MTIMNMAKAILRNKALAVVLAVGSGLLPTWVQGQDAPRLITRFANPAYNPTTRVYSVDVEATSKMAEEVFLGMNLRFFYDASKLEFKGIDEYARGLDYIHHAPRASVGNDQSGVQLLGLQRAAGYVNGGIQSVDEQRPVVLKPGAWTKLCRATFLVPVIFQEATEFCPSLIWDKKPFLDQGGILGSDGVLIDVKEFDRSTQTDAKRSIVEGEPFNWQYSRLQDRPFGDAWSTDCLSLAGTTATEDPDLTTADDYVLFQNHPNPFDDQTTIEFIVPYEQDAKLNLYNLQGQLLEQIKGHYTAGRNKLVLQRKPWMDRVEVVYYQLVAGEGDSVTLVRKMNMVTR